MTINDLEYGDILIYRNNKVHYVNQNKEKKYKAYFNNDLTNKNNHNYDIIQVQRYKKFLWFYLKKTLYVRENDN